MSDEPEGERELITAGRRAMRELPEVPGAVVHRAQALWPASPGLLTRIQALLSIDSFATPLPAVRSGSERTRQMLFTAGTRDIDVRIVPDHDTWNLEGQVLGPSDAGTLCVQRDGEQVAMVALDELGAFAIAGLASGSYQLVLYFEHERVALPGLDVRRDAP